MNNATESENPQENEEWMTEEKYTEKYTKMTFILKVQGAEHEVLNIIIWNYFNKKLKHSRFLCIYLFTYFIISNIIIIFAVQTFNKG